VTSGYGTFATSGSVNANDYLTAGRTSDGRLAMAYVPSSRTLSVDLSRLNGAVAARCYGPSNITFMTIAGSPFANTGPLPFTTPGNNQDGDGDWVLVESSAPDGQAPSAPLNVSAVAVSSSQVNLSWTASTDNIGIAGYDIYRNGAFVRSSSTATASDSPMLGSTWYSYGVIARDGAGNPSTASNTGLSRPPAATRSR
jgi:hypothetical protein